MKMNALYIHGGGISAGPKELKFRLKAFEAGYKAGKLNESKKFDSDNVIKESISEVTSEN